VVLSIGFAVDNTAHICHAYMLAPTVTCPTREDRVKFALEAVGSPIILGDISTLLAIIPMVIAAENEVIVVFGKSMLP